VPQCAPELCDPTALQPATEYARCFTWSEAAAPLQLLASHYTDAASNVGMYNLEKELRLQVVAIDALGSAAVASSTDKTRAAVAATSTLAGCRCLDQWQVRVRVMRAAVRTWGGQ
jgi:hypothetical protein